MHFKARTPSLPLTKRVFRKVFLSSCLTLFSVDALAVNTDWNVPSGSWNVAGNWTAGVPTNADLAEIGNGGTASVGAGVNALANTVLVGGALNGNLVVTGGGTLNISSPSAALSIGGGGFFTAGSVTVDGSGSTISSSGTIVVGVAASSFGALVVANNALVSTDSAVALSNGPPGNLFLNSGATLSTPILAFISSAGTASFDGGILKERSISTPDFILKLPTTSYNLKINAGGAKIDSNGFNIGTALIFTGVGGLTKQGAGTFTLRGDNLYTGDTTIAAGTLELGNGSTTGSVAGNIVDNAALKINRSNTFTYGGLISGVGTVIQSGVGTTIFTEDNTYTGGTTISGGTLQLGNGGTTGSVFGNILNNSNLTINRSNTYTYDNVISGTGSLTKEGIGTLVLNGVNTYTGNTTINNGALLLGDPTHQTASVGGNVTINADGTLSGYGSVGGNVVNDGTVNPGLGTSVGTLSIGGTYTQHAGGTYGVQVTQAGTNDKLAVTGTATLSGALAINDIGTGFLVGHVYQLLTANSVIGLFSPVTLNGFSSHPFVTTTVTYDPTIAPTAVDLVMDLNPTAFEFAAITPNQIAVADYLLVTGGGTAATQALLSTLTTDAQFQAAMDQISGATYANQTMALAHVGSWFEHELANRLMAFPSANDPCCLCSNGQLKYRNNNQAPGGWVSVYGGQDDINAGQVSGLITNTEGVALGYEWPMNCQTKLGLGVGYTHFRGHATERESASDNGNLLQAGIYGRYERCGWLFGAAADIGTTNDLNTERHIQGATAVFSPRSHYRANVISEQVVAAYDLLQSKRCWKLRPFVGFINQQVNSDGFTEEGNSGFELNVGSNDYHSARSQLGVLWEAPMTQCVRPFASVDWEHEFADRNGSFDASLVGLPTPPTFHIVGQEIGRDSAAVKAGLNLVRQGRFNLAVLYQGQFASGWQQNGAALEAGFRFD